MKNVKWLVVVLCFAVLALYACQSLKRTKAPAHKTTTKAAVTCDGKKGAELIKAVFPTDAVWENIFKVASTNPVCTGKKPLSRDNLISAVSDRRYGAFLGSESTEKNLQELAAFLANTSHETNGAAAGKLDGGLCFAREVGCPSATCEPGKGCGAYCSDTNTGPKCPCGYYGRGALQISWPSNYKEVSLDIFEDDRLYQDPDKLLEGDTAWKASLVFWLNHVGGYDERSETTIKKKTTCHSAMASGTFDFGKTIEVINGDIECHAKDNENARNRVDYYNSYIKSFAAACGMTVTPTANLACVSDTPRPPDKTVRCGDSWETADKTCGAVCRVKEDCPAGQMCFAGLSLSPCQ